MTCGDSGRVDGPWVSLHRPDALTVSNWSWPPRQSPRRSPCAASERAARSRCACGDQSLASSRRAPAGGGSVDSHGSVG